MTPNTTCDSAGCGIYFVNDTNTILPDMAFHTPYKSTTNIIDQAGSMIKNLWTISPDDSIDIDGVDGTNQGVIGASTGSLENIQTGEGVNISVPFNVNPLDLIAANGWAEGVVEAKVGGAVIESAVANFPDPYSQIQESVDANIAVTNNPGSVYWGESVDINVDPAPNYEIATPPTGCDTLTGNSGGYVCTVNGDGDTTITASASPIIHMLSVHVLDGVGRLLPRPQALIQAQTITVSHTSREVLLP